MKQGDFGFTLSTQLTEKIEDQAETPFDLTGKTVRVRIQYPTGSTVERIPTVDNASQGRISFTLLAADTANVGVHTSTVVVTSGGSLQKTFPSDGRLSYEVEPAIVVS